MADHNIELLAWLPMGIAVVAAGASIFAAFISGKPKKSEVKLSRVNENIRQLEKLQNEVTKETDKLSILFKKIPGPPEIIEELMESFHEMQRTFRVYQHYLRESQRAKLSSMISEIDQKRDREDVSGVVEGYMDFAAQLENSITFELNDVCDELRGI